MDAGSWMAFWFHKSTYVFALRTIAEYEVCVIASLSHQYIMDQNPTLNAYMRTLHESFAQPPNKLGKKKAGKARVVYILFAWWIRNTNPTRNRIHIFSPGKVLLYCNFTLHYYVMDRNLTLKDLPATKFYPKMNIARLAHCQPGLKPITRRGLARTPTFRSGAHPSKVRKTHPSWRSRAYPGSRKQSADS